MKTDEKTYEGITDPHDFEKVKKALVDAKIECSLAEITYVPENYVKLDDKHAEHVLKLIDTLEDHDDVQKVHSNFDIPEEIMEKVAAAGLLPRAPAASHRSIRDESSSMCRCCATPSSFR